MAKRNWASAEAKAKFSELLECAENAPQTILKNGKEKAVVVSIDEWNKRTKPKETLVEFFQNSPFRGSGVKFERMRGKFRENEL